MIQKIVILLTFILVLSGCFHHYPDVGLYHQKMQQQKDVAVGLYSQAIKDSSTSLMLGETLNLELNEQSPIIFNDDYSFFKSYKVVGIKDQKFNVEVKSFVSGNGFKPFVAIPKLTVISSNNELILDKPESMKGYHPTFSGGYRMTGKWQGQFSKDGVYYFIVSTDNSKLNQSVGNSSTFTYTSGFVGRVGWTYFAHYMGKMEIVLN